MIKKDRVLLYKIIAIACTIILCLVQLLHIRNIYKLEEEVYSIDEKPIIKTEYEESIINDKVFPGGVSIIDTIIYRNLPTLEILAKKDNQSFKELSTKVCDTIFRELRANNNMDAFLDSVRKKHKIETDITYALVVEQVDIAIEPNHYYTLFNDSSDKITTGFPYKQNVGALI